MKEVFNNKEEICKLSIYTTRIIRKHGEKINNSDSYSSFDELMNYIEDNNIKKIDLINIEIRYNNYKSLSFQYDGYERVWILKYREKDSFTDSIIYNLNNLFKKEKLLFLLSYVDYLFYTINISYLVIRWIVRFGNIYFDLIYLIICIGLFILMRLKNKYAYYENEFIHKNRDSIILSFIFYVLGLFSSYFIGFIQNLLNK